MQCIGSVKKYASSESLRHYDTCQKATCITHLSQLKKTVTLLHTQIISITPLYFKKHQKSVVHIFYPVCDLRK